MFRIHTFLCFFGISACFIADTVARQVIIDGDRAGPNDILYQVSLFVDGALFCGGGIINDLMILSAAHCLLQSNREFFTDPITILAATNNLSSTDMHVVKRKVKRIYVPSAIQVLPTNIIGDISILKLNESLGLSRHKHLKALQLPRNRHETHIGKTAIIAGFGWHWITIDADGKENGGTYDDILRYAEVDIVNCHKNVVSAAYMERQLCGHVKQRHSTIGRGICVNDSGSPLVKNGTVIGILSVGPNGCSERNVSAVYTRISYYLEFIRQAEFDQLTHHIRMHEFP